MGTILEIPMSPSVEKRDRIVCSCCVGRGVGLAPFWPHTVGSMLRAIQNIPSDFSGSLFGLPDRAVKTIQNNQAASKSDVKVYQTSRSCDGTPQGREISDTNKKLERKYKPELTPIRA